MTSASADRPRGGRVGDFLAWLSHFDVWLAVVFAVTTVVSGLAYPAPERGWWGTAVPLALMLLPIGAVIGGLFHDRRPCERCMERFPLDASAEAEQKRWALRVIHWSHRRMLLTMGAAYLALVGLPFLLGPRLGTLGLIPWFGGWIVLIYARRQHNKLSPWCPWCRNGGRGPRSSVTPPTPRNTVDA